MTNRDEEIEEARASASKKVKILEQQLEQVQYMCRFKGIIHKFRIATYNKSAKNVEEDKNINIKSDLKSYRFQFYINFHLSFF